MFSSTSNPNPKTKTLNITTSKNNLNYIKKFELHIDIAKYINSCLIFNDVYIDDLTIVLDIKLNS